MLFVLIIIFVNMHCCPGFGPKKIKQASAMPPKKPNKQNPQLRKVIQV